MSIDFGKRISDLKKQTEESQSGRWRLRPVAFLSIFVFIILRYTILPTIDVPEDKNLEGQSNSAANSIEAQEDYWIKEIKVVIKDRVRFLSNSPLVLVPFSSSIYSSLASTLDQRFELRSAKKSIEESELPFTFSDLPIWWNRLAVSGVLRIVFVLLCAIPYWILGVVAGLVIIRTHRKQKPSDTLLGVCDRKTGPFYSGIYGPYRPNGNVSATDLSCPGLACPQMSPLSEAESHPLASLLKSHGALNDTNKELLRIILAHKDFPHGVEEENSIQREEIENPYDLENRVSKTNFTPKGGLTLIQGTSDYLPALLDAHAIAKKYVDSLIKKAIKVEALDANYPGHIAALLQMSASCSVLTKRLLTSLTPRRLWALATIDCNMVISSFLAAEAGKALVYKRLGEGFTTISMYPHLQARAVLNSIVPFHKEYDGDQRLILRQAIISSRRHGDFGRSFLPIRMSIQSRAIRDILEILYMESSKQEEIANLVELDGHIEEVHSNFKMNYVEKIREGDHVQDLSKKSHELSKGLSHKSVVLLPLEKLIEFSLKGFHEQRLDRILKLLDLTRKFQSQISTSARLPGFKRQAMEADKSGEESDPIVQKLYQYKNGKELVRKWRIARRMLIRFNWLSTRIGDDSVPIIGLVHGLIKHRDKTNIPKFLFLDALVPLRQRRYAEVLGKNWEHNYYRYSPYQDSVEVFISTSDYERKSKSKDAAPAPSAIPAEERMMMAVGEN